MITQIKGETIVRKATAKASTAYALNGIVAFDGSGHVIPATNATTVANMVGLIDRAIASTDDDYASEKTVGVILFHDGAEFEGDVSGGTLDADDIGTNVDLVNSETLDGSGTATVDQFTITDVLGSGDKARFVLNN